MSVSCKNYCIISILVIAALILFGNKIYQPFLHAWEKPAVIVANYARQYERYGLISSKLGLIEMTSGIDKNQFFYFNLTGSSFIPILIYIVNILLHNLLISSRTIGLILGIAALLAFFHLSQKMRGVRLAIAVAFLSIVLPATQQFIIVPLEEWLIIFLLLISFANYYLFITKQKITFAYIFLGLSFFASLVSWFGYILIASFIIQLLFQKKIKTYGNIIIILFLEFFISLLIKIVHIAILAHGSVLTLEGSVQSISIIWSYISINNLNFLNNYLNNQIRYILILYPRTLLILPIIFLGSIIRDWWLYDTAKLEKQIIFWLFISVFGYLFLFSKSIAYSPQAVLLLLPFIVFSSCWIINSFFDYIKIKSIEQSILLMSIIGYFAYFGLVASIMLNQKYIDSTSFVFGTFIKNNADGNDILVQGTSWVRYYLPFFNFYSEKNIVPADFTLLTWISQGKIIKSKYKEFIITDKQNISAEIIAYLNQYPRIVSGPFIMYKLQN